MRYVGYFPIVAQEENAFYFPRKIGGITLYSFFRKNSNSLE